MDGAFAILGQLAAIYLNTGTVPQRRSPEDLHGQIVPYGTFVAQDGRYLNVCVPNNKFWVGTGDKGIERLLARGIPAGPVHTLDEVVKDGYVDEAGMLTRMNHPTCGPVVVPSIPIRLSATPGAIRLPPT